MVYLYEFVVLSKLYRVVFYCCYVLVVIYDFVFVGWLGMIEVVEVMMKWWGRFIVGGDMVVKVEVGELWWLVFKGGLEEGEILVFG